MNTSMLSNLSSARPSSTRRSGRATRARRKLQIVMFAAGAAITNAVSYGAIISANPPGSWLLVPPPSVLPNALLGAPARVFNERQNVTLPSSGLLVDMINTGPGQVSSNAAVAGLLTGIVDSHFIHYAANVSFVAQGSVTYNNPIVGVIFSDTLLNATDGLLGIPSTAYPTAFPARGTSFPSTFTVNGNTITYDLTFSGLEQVRVLTAAPAPGSLALLGLGGLLAARRRR